MANPLMSGNRQNGGNLFSNFLSFKNSFKGDPRQTVQELLNSGKMSQEQFNQLQEMAKNFQSMFNIR